MYRDDKLVSLAYECYYEQTFANTSFVLGLGDRSSIGPAMEGIGDKVRTLKDKLMEFLERLINFVKKLLGFDTHLTEVSLHEPEQIKHVVQFINHYQEINRYGQEMINLGKLCQVLYKSGDNDDVSKLEDLLHEMDELRRIIDDVPENYPSEFTFKFPDVKAKLNRATAYSQKARDILKGLADSSRSRSAYNSAFNNFRERVAYYSVLLTNVSHAVKMSITAKGEKQFLNSKKVASYKGINVVGAKVTGKLYFTYTPADDAVTKKWGNIFIVVDPDFFAKLSRDAKVFLLEHEIGHVELIKMGEEESLSPAEREFHCDKVAMDNMGRDIDTVIKIFEEITNTAIKSDPMRVATYKKIAAIRMKHLIDIKKRKEESDTIKAEMEKDEKLKSEDPLKDLDNIGDEDPDLELDDSKEDTKSTEEDPHESIDKAIDDIDNIGKEEKPSKKDKVDDEPDLDEGIRDLEEFTDEYDKKSKDKEDFDELDDLKDIGKIDKEEEKKKKASKKKKRKDPLDELDDLI